MYLADELQANTLKDLGNKAFSAKEYDKAIDLFTQAIALDSKNHVLFSNRSAAHAGKRDWTKALQDAEQCVSINPSWSKGYARKGAALHGARKYDEAIVAYEAGLKLEDSPALRKGLKEVQDAQGKSAIFHHIPTTWTVFCSCGYLRSGNGVLRSWQDVLRSQLNRKVGCQPENAETSR